MRRSRLTCIGDSSSLVVVVLFSRIARTGESGGLLIERDNQLYPVLLKLAGRRVLVVGAGGVAERKIAALIPTGAIINVVAPEATTEITALADAGKIALHHKRFQPEDMAGAWLAIAAADRETNLAAANEAERRSIPINAVDEPDLCGFFAPAVHRDGPITMAVSTSGAAPRYAARLRDQLARAVPDYAAGLADFIGRMRRELSRRFPDDIARRKKGAFEFSSADFETLYRERGEETAEAEAQRIIEKLAGGAD